MARPPLPGKVKTRLAETVGDQKALEIYNALLAHTVSVAVDSHLPVMWFWAEPSNIVLSETFNYHTQVGNNLGERMLYAFEFGFHSGFDEIVMIGTDCVELESSHLHLAMKSLESCDIVLGPAKDGGYYLVAMKKVHSEIFSGMPWSTDTLLSKTIDKCNSLALTFILLPELRDVDTIGDLKKSRIAHLLNT
jgi:rSAM/selenodomain-associated transferase 1